jgi:hypothetical protein
MRFLIPSVIFTVSLASAQSTHLLGVWKADLEKSHIPAPPNMPVKQYLVLFEQITGRRGEKLIKDTTGEWLEKRGLDKSVFTFRDDNKPAMTDYEGVPTRVTAFWQDRVLEMTMEIAGTPRVIKSKYQLSADGQTLTIDSEITGGPRPVHSTVVLTKQPQDAAGPLLAPEQTAAEHFKNVKTEELKNLPVSEFIDQMHYFAWSLGKDCEFCHVRNDFASDDKKEKKTARDMIRMVAAIDRDNFKGRPEVRCFTCHQAHSHPLRYPPFPGEQSASAEAAHEARAADPNSHANPAPRP